MSRDKSPPSTERPVRRSAGRAAGAVTGEAGVLLPGEAVSDSEATQSSTAFTVVLPPSAQALPAHCRTWARPLGLRPCNACVAPIFGAFVQRTQAANLAMYGPAVIVL